MTIAVDSEVEAEVELHIEAGWVLGPQLSGYLLVPQHEEGFSLSKLKALQYLHLEEEGGRGGEGRRGRGEGRGGKERERRGEGREERDGWEGERKQFRS